MPVDEMYDANVRVRDLPRSVDIELNKIAARMSLPKYEIVKRALIEFAERHRIA